MRMVAAFRIWRAVTMMASRGSACGFANKLLGVLRMQNFCTILTDAYEGNIVRSPSGFGLVGVERKSLHTRGAFNTGGKHEVCFRRDRSSFGDFSSGKRLGLMGRRSVDREHYWQSDFGIFTGHGKGYRKRSAKRNSSIRLLFPKVLFGAREKQGQRTPVPFAGISPFHGFRPDAGRCAGTGNAGGNIQ